MSEDNEFDWGTKKMKYYQMNKREDNEEENDSDFIEEEKEAIRLQKLKFEKIKKAKLLNEEEEEKESEEEKKENNKKKKEESKKNELKNEISFKPIEIDNIKIIEDINLLKNCLEEYQTTNEEIKILNDNKKIKLPKTISYLNEYKKLNILYSANILYNIISTLNSKMTGHHPSIKNSAIFNYLLTKNSEKNEKIQNNIEQILLSLEKENKKSEEMENEDKDEQIKDKEEDELDEEIEENLEEGEEIEDDMEEENKEEEEEEEDNEEEEIEKENQKVKKNLISNNLIGNINDPVKKPSFLNKKKKRENTDKEIDLKDNDNFDNEEEKSEEENDNEEEEDSLIKEQYKSFNKLKKEKELLDKKKKEDEEKDIEKKNDFAIRKANKEVLKARGIYRKRKRYQGNAKLMNREKFYKKEKERKKYVKEYAGKPDVYTGEATGIRRDLIRSTKIY